MKELSSYQPLSELEEMRTLTGTVAIGTGEEDENERYFTSQIGYFRVQGEILEKLNLHLKSFYKNMQEACESLEDAQKDFHL